MIVVPDIRLRYVDDILKSTPKSIDQVVIEPDGKWAQTTGSAPSPPRTNGRTSSDGEDDLVEIQDMPRLAPVKKEVTNEPGLMRTPPISSREQSFSSAAAPIPASSKRSSGPIVDLTLSSDEEDEPPRPAKRQMTHRPSSGLPRLSSIDSIPIRPNGVEMPRNPFAPPSYVAKEYRNPP